MCREEECLRSIDIWLIAPFYVPTRAILSILYQSLSDGQTKCSSLEDLKLQSITPSRQVMGYATRMGYQLSTSKFGGLGFISLSKLIEAIELSCAAGVGHIVCLARSHGTQYRFVKLQLLTWVLNCVDHVNIYTMWMIIKRTHWLHHFKWTY